MQLILLYSQTMKKTATCSPENTVPTLLDKHLHKDLLLAPKECLDLTFHWFRGLATFPLLPSQGEEEEDDEGLDESLKETAKEREERKTDHDVAGQDVVKVI